LEGKEKYNVEVSNRFVAIEDLVSEEESNSDWEMIRETITISAKENLCFHELQKHKPWFDKGYSKLLDGRKHFSGYWFQVKEME
jgi:hypothetical protein